MPKQLTPDRNLTISLEAMAMEWWKIPDVKTLFQRILPDFITAVKVTQGRLAELVKGPALETTFQLKETQAAVFKEVQMLSFLDHAKTLQLEVPEDFQGNWNLYLETLIDLHKASDQLFNKALATYRVLLSAFISNPDDRIALKTHRAFYEGVQASREALLDQLNKFFPNDTGRSSAPLGTLLQRWNDLEPIYSHAASLKLHLDRKSLGTALGEVNQAVGLLDTLLTGLKTDDIVRISPESAENLARGAYELGKLAEFYAVLHTDTRTAVVVTDRIFTTLGAIHTAKPLSA